MVESYPLVCGTKGADPAPEGCGRCHLIPCFPGLKEFEVQRLHGMTRKPL